MNMTRILQAVSRVCAVGTATAMLLAASASGQAQTSKVKPDPEVKLLEAWAGDWKYEATTTETPLGPGGKSSGTQSAHWILNGFFLDFLWRENGPQGNLGAVEMDWYDPVTKSLKWHGFMDNGDTYFSTVTVNGKVWKSSGTQTHNGVPYKTRGETTFSADGSTGTWKNEMSTDGQQWLVCNEGKMTRIPSQESSVEQEIIRREKIWTATAVSRDTAALAPLLAEDMTSGNAEGKWYTKAQVLADLKSGDYTATAAECDNLKVRVFGDIAIVTGRTTEKSRFKGVDSSGEYIWTDTWQKRDGAWFCIATHGSKVGTKLGP